MTIWDERRRPLRVLHLEDDPGDVSLVQATLRADGLECDVTNVQTREDFVAALEREPWSGPEGD